MSREITKRAVALATFLVVAAAITPARAQHHGGYGGSGHHYGGRHAFGRYGFGAHFSSGHHYNPYAYGYNYYAGPAGYVPRVYAYSRPQTAYVDPPSEQGRSSEGLSYQRRAESAFRGHHYNEAIRWARRAAAQTPRDGRLFLLLSQAHLAVGEYREAAGAARQGMSLLPPNDWGDMIQNFGRYYHDADYADQVRRLERFIKQNPNHGDARFLVGYHWVFLGYPNQANRELTKAAQLNSRDEWSNRLLELVAGAAPGQLPGPASDPLPPSTPGAREGQIATDGHRHGHGSHGGNVPGTEPGPVLGEYPPPSGPVEKLRGSGRGSNVQN